MGELIRQIKSYKKYFPKSIDWNYKVYFHLVIPPKESLVNKTCEYLDWFKQIGNFSVTIFDTSKNKDYDFYVNEKILKGLRTDDPSLETADDSEVFMKWIKELVNLK